MEGLSEIVKLLLVGGANPNIKNIVGYIHLHDAVYYEYPEIVHLLLKFKSNVNDQDESGNTPLHYAIQKKQ